MVLGEVMRTALIGVSAGLLVGWAVARLVSRRLWGVTPSDPVSFLLGAAVLLVTALFAGWWPA
jgi:NhaP-type Na+/H+ or K+/H+ antiporter